MDVCVFLLLAVMNSAAVNIHGQGFVWMLMLSFSWADTWEWNCWVTWELQDCFLFPPTVFSDILTNPCYCLFDSSSFSEGVGVSK